MKEFLRNLVKGFALKGYKRFIAIALFAASAFIPDEFKPLLEVLKQALGVDPLLAGAVTASTFAVADKVVEKVSNRKVAFPVD